MMIFQKINCLLFLLFTLAIATYAQQDPLFTQYMNNPVLINPAYAGSHTNLNVSGIFRKQWLNLDWSPTTTTLSVGSPFKDYDVGVGFSFVHDQIGPLNQTGLYLDYARNLRFSKNRTLSLGLKAGFNYFDVNLLNLITAEYDPYIASNPKDSDILPNFGIGIFYFASDYYIGLSVPKLIRNSYDKDENTLEIVGREERHYYLTAGYVFSIDDLLWKFKPSLMARVVNGAPASFELSGTFIFYETVWFGLTYRLGDAFAAHARWQVNDRFQIGYSYDLNNSRLRFYNNGSHEVFLCYDFSFRGRRILSPRYF